MADVSLNFGDGSPAGSADFGATTSHTFDRAGTFGIQANTPTGRFGVTRVSGPGAFDIVVTDNDAPPPVAATGATAGTPGTYTPAGSATPATGAAIAALVATPATLWTEGQYVVAVNADERYWDGAAWQTGRAPAAVEDGGEE